MTDILLKTEDLTKDYRVGSEMVHALRAVSVEIRRGDFVAVTGPSGSGKSTFMNLLGCLDSPTAGRYILDGRDVSHLTADELAEVRNRKIGFVFQSFNLLPRTPAIENVELPLRYSGMPRAQRHDRARTALAAVGWKTAFGTTPRSCPADSSSAWPSPARWPTSRSWFWPTNPRARSTPRPAWTS
jgi:putative ABC transport system ATP-binding protein